MRIQFVFSKFGVALVTVMIFMFILLISGATFLRLATFEGILSKKDIQSSRAFYIAEAGVQRALAYLRVEGNQYSTEPINESFAGGSYSVTPADNPTRSIKTITATGSFKDRQKTIIVEVQLMPDFFKNTFTSPGNLELWGILASAYAHGTTWLSGVYDSMGWFQDMGFDVLVENMDSEKTTLRFPDMNNNSIVNEFSDFVLFFQNEVQQLDPSEVVWLQTDGTVDIWPDRDYAGKKIIFVEGSVPGAGDVNIWFDSGSWWESGQDVTIVSTGDVNYIQPLQNPSNNRLSVICWGNFSEGAIIYSAHRSVIGTQGVADLTYIIALINVTGAIFANDHVDIHSALVRADFYHDDTLNIGDIPPGLRPLCTNSYYLGDIISWQEGA